MRACVCVCAHVSHTYGAHIPTHQQHRGFTNARLACWFNYAGSRPMTYFLLFMMCCRRPCARADPERETPCVCRVCCDCIQSHNSWSYSSAGHTLAPALARTLKHFVGWFTGDAHQDYNQRWGSAGSCSF